MVGTIRRRIQFCVQWYKLQIVTCSQSGTAHSNVFLSKKFFTFLLTWGKNQIVFTNIFCGQQNKKHLVLYCAEFNSASIDAFLVKQVPLFQLSLKKTRMFKNLRALSNF